MKVIDDKSKKKLNWWNRNYFFIGALLVIAANLLIFAFANDWYVNLFKVEGGDHWNDIFYFTPTLLTFFSSFSHASWQHVLLNMLCFLVAGIYIERKRGSISTILLVVFAAFISALAITTNALSVGSVGFSGVNYFLYAYIIIDYLFSFQKTERNKFNTIFGGIVLVIIYLATCYNESLAEFAFTWYPHNLIHNLAHYSSFIAGLIVCFVISFVRFMTRREIKALLKTENEDKDKTAAITHSQQVTQNEQKEELLKEETEVKTETSTIKDEGVSDTCKTVCPLIVEAGIDESAMTQPAVQKENQEPKEESAIQLLQAEISDTQEEHKHKKIKQKENKQEISKNEEIEQDQPSMVEHVNQEKQELEEDFQLSTQEELSTKELVLKRMREQSQNKK